MVPLMVTVELPLAAPWMKVRPVLLCRPRVPAGTLRVTVVVVLSASLTLMRLAPLRVRLLSSLPETVVGAVTTGAGRG